MAIPAGWTEIAPGVYRDRDDAMHISIPELLRANGWPDTPENREIATHAAAEMARELGISSTVKD